MLQLVGGGWAPAARSAVYGPFLDAAGDRPDVACVVVDEGDGAAQAARWTAALSATAPCAPAPVLVPLGGRLDVADLEGADALLVCGGLTPAYAAALAPAAPALRAWLAAGRPYAGFSAGAAVAPARAVVGGWLDRGVPVCPSDAAEDEEEMAVVAGLGLVPWAVDVHCGAWGTLGRLVAAVARGVAGGGVAAGVGIDEDTAIVVDGAQARVTGLGRAHAVTRVADGGVLVRPVPAGGMLDVEGVAGPAGRVGSP